MMIRGRVSTVPNLRHRGRRVSGLFMPGGAFPHIRFEAHEPPRRQRFTIAHELGHCYLDPLQETVCDPAVMESDSITEEHDVRESEADAFAAAFLIPADRLIPDLRQFGPCASFFADLYDVSDPTMGRRLRVLELITQ
jgi:Zn-dependent peptidase ImmA (M78 family)